MKKPKRRRNYSKLIIRFIFVFAAFYVASTFYDQHKEMKYLKAREETLLQSVSAMEKDVQLLKNQIENSNTDEHIERIAREQLRMVKKDELLFIDLGKASGQK